MEGAIRGWSLPRPGLMQDPGKDLPVIVLIAARGTLEGQAKSEAAQRLKLTFWARAGGETSFFLVF